MKYHRSKNSSWNPTIETVEIERQTDNYVWINGRRNAKISSYESYFETFEEAKDYLISISDKNVLKAKEDLNHAEQIHIQVNMIKKES